MDKVKLYEIVNCLEQIAPKAYAEDFDNVGLLVGDIQSTINKTMITLDCTEEIIDQCIDKNSNLIITFHPIIFKAIKRITGQNYVERILLKAIKHDIAIYAIHTNLDFSFQGSNQILAQKLGLIDPKVLIHKSNTIQKLSTFVPTQQAEKVLQALFDAGAGNIGNYSHCSFQFEGMGSFCGNESSQPVIGEKGKTHVESETCINVTFEWYKQHQIIAALKSAHPYEEVAYEIIQLENENQLIGIGLCGELEAPMSELEFLRFLKKILNTDCIRHSRLTQNTIKKVALLGGAGSFALNAAKSAGADAFISADFKYHEFFNAENQILICDVGHYECEQYIPELLKQKLEQKFAHLCIELSTIKTNPVNYFLG